MLTISSKFQSNARLKSAVLSTVAVIGLLQAHPAIARSNQQTVTNSVAQGARACVTSKLCSVTPTGRAFGGAVRSMDRLGWEIGRGMSIKKYGPAGDPGQYPGMKR